MRFEVSPKHKQNMSGGHPQSTLPASLEQASRLGLRDRIVTLGHALRGAHGSARDSMALMLIELAAQGRGVTHGHRSEAHASGPIELITRLPARWRERHADDALQALARAWPNIPADARPLALAVGRERWIETTKLLAGHAEADARLAAISIAHDTADPALGSVVCTLLGDEEQRVRQAADETVLRMSLRQLRHVPSELLGTHYASIANQGVVSFPADPDVLELERHVLLRAVSDAAYGFASHRCRSPLVALLLLIDHRNVSRVEREISDRMRRLLAMRNHPSHAPIRTLLKRTDCPLLRERALRWLPIDAISNAALERLRVPESLIEHEIMLQNAHLAVRPSRAKKLSTITSPRSASRAQEVLPSAQQWKTLSRSARLGVVSLNPLIGGDEQARRSRIEPALADEGLHVRLRAAGLCPAIDLQDFVFDADGVISRHAGIRWSTLGAEPPRFDSPSSTTRIRLSVLASRSPHDTTRRIAHDELARLTISDSSHPASRQRARCYMQADPAGFIRTMRDRLAMASTCLETIMMIRLLGVERRFELDLIGIVQSEHSEHRSRACAVAALARVQSNAAKYILDEALGDRDPRTRANAVEHAQIPFDRLMVFSDDTDHRARANAVRRAIVSGVESETEKARDASGALIELLGDPRPMHRLAGSWVAQHTVVSRNRGRLGTRWSPIISQLEELAAVDEDPRLRERARRCIQRLASEIRCGATSSSDLSQDLAGEA